MLTGTAARTSVAARLDPPVVLLNSDEGYGGRPTRPLVQSMIVHLFWRGITHVPRQGQSFLAVLCFWFRRSSSGRPRDTVSILHPN